MSEQTAQTGPRPEAVAAAAWWASRFGMANSSHDAGTGNASEMDLTIMLNLDTVRGSRTPEEQEQFRAALEAVIDEHLRECPSCDRYPGAGVRHYIRVEYDPDDLLSAAADRAGLDVHSREFPVKTFMIFDPEKVIASEGYAAPLTDVWRSA